MNAAGNFRYVTEGGWVDFADCEPARTSPGDRADSLLAELPPARRGRAAAFGPGGPYALRLAEHPVALIIGRNLFVHGGIRPEHVAYGLARLNRETLLWLRGEGPLPPLLEQRDSPLWTRCYCTEVDDAACELLAEVLTDLKCDRLIVGHTIQTGGITPHCGARVWCLDTGASAHYGGPLQVLEIRADSLRILEWPAPLQTEEVEYEDIKEINY